MFKNEFRHQGIPFYRGTEIGMLAEGKRLEPSLFIDESHYLELIEQTGKIENGDLLLPSICPDGRVWCVDSDEPFYIKDGRVLWICSFVEGVDSRYLCYQISSLLVHRYSSYASGASFAELKIFALEKMLIPVPPLAEQQRIAGILDEFDALTTSLTDGLPAEIEARRAQYAYYRDRLLAFPEKPVA